MPFLPSSHSVQRQRAVRTVRPQNSAFGAAASLRERGVVQRGFGVVEKRAEAFALQYVRRGHAGEIAERGIDVEQLDEAGAALAVGLCARSDRR